MAFVALEVSLELVDGLRGLLGQIETMDRDLASQLRRAASSIALNLGEGAERRGKDRVHCFRIASGSAAEVHAGLRLAAAWGHVPPAAIEPSLARLDRLRALFFGLTRR